MVELKTFEEYRELVEVAVEHALVTMGSPELEKVRVMLKEEYGVTIADSLDHPEYLKKILCELFGNAYQDIIDTIYSVIDSDKEERIVKDFLYVMEN